MQLGPQNHLQHHVRAPPWAGTEGKSPLRPDLFQRLLSFGTSSMDMRMGQRSGRDTQTYGHLDHPLETPHGPQTCHLQGHCSFSIRASIFHSADILAIIRGSQPDDSQVQTSTGETVSGQLCPSSIFLHLLCILVLSVSVAVHRFRELVPDPPDLQAPSVHAGGQVTRQHDVPPHGGMERVVWSHHSEVSLVMERDTEIAATLIYGHCMARGELGISSACSIPWALLCPPRGPKTLEREDSKEKEVSWEWEPAPENDLHPSQPWYK